MHGGGGGGGDFHAHDGDGGNVDRSPYSCPDSFFHFQVGLHYLRTWFIPDLWCSLPYSTMQPLLQPLLEEVRDETILRCTVSRTVVCSAIWYGTMWYGVMLW